jgi:molecular chaperone DnaK (HSP70)
MDWALATLRTHLRIPRLHTGYDLTSKLVCQSTRCQISAKYQTYLIWSRRVSSSAQKLPFSLGISSRYGLFLPLIHSGCQVPVEISERFTATSDNVTREEIRIFQGNNALVRNNFQLGVLKFTVSEPKSPAEISLTFSLQKDLLLHVAAYDTNLTSCLQTILLRIEPNFESCGHDLRPEEREEIRFIQAREQGEDILRSVKTAFSSAKINWTTVPSIDCGIKELQAALETNEFANYSSINDRALALKDTTMDYFEGTHYRHHQYRRVQNESIFPTSDSQFPLF